MDSYPPVFHHRREDLPEHWTEPDSHYHRKCNGLLRRCMLATSLRDSLDLGHSHGSLRLVHQRSRVDIEGHLQQDDPQR